MFQLGFQLGQCVAWEHQYGSMQTLVCRFTQANWLKCNFRCVLICSTAECFSACLSSLLIRLDSFGFVGKSHSWLIKSRIILCPCKLDHCSLPRGEKCIWSSETIYARCPGNLKKKKLFVNNFFLMAEIHRHDLHGGPSQFSIHSNLVCGYVYNRKWDLGSRTKRDLYCQMRFCLGSSQLLAAVWSFTDGSRGTAMRSKGLNRMQLPNHSMQRPYYSSVNLNNEKEVKLFNAICLMLCRKKLLPLRPKLATEALQGIQ